MNLSDDERMLLKALAAAKEPIGAHEVLDAVLPPRPMLWPRKTGKEQWATRHDELGRAWRGLKWRGLIDLVADGGLHVITDAGWEALAGTKETPPHA